MITIAEKESEERLNGRPAAAKRMDADTAGTEIEAETDADTAGTEIEAETDADD